MLRRHLSTVRRLCLRRAGGDIDRCGDMMQEVAIALWLHFDQLRPDATPHEERAWVCWQCRSTLDLLRRKEHLELQPLPVGAEQLPEADDNAGLREEVDDLMSTLTSDERQIMHWQLEGYNADDIARLMGIGRNTVYQRVWRALTKMRRVALLLLALFAVTTVAVAVVPQWRHIIFGGREPVDTMPAEPMPVSAESGIDSVEPSPLPKPAPKSRPRMEPMEHMQEVEPQADEELPVIDDSPIVEIDGNKVVVSGVYGERVTIYSMYGNILASQVCNGICTFTILPDNTPYGDRLSYTIKIGDRQGIFISSR